MRAISQQSAPQSTQDSVQGKIQVLRSNPYYPHANERAAIEAARRARWERGQPAATRATEAVKNGIRTACEISVAMSSDKSEVERHKNEANRQFNSADNAEMGSHLTARMEEIDKFVQKLEKGEVFNLSPEKKKFVEEKFRELCTSLDEVSRDPSLVRDRPELRSELFPKVAIADRRPLFGGVHVFIAAQYNKPGSPAPAPIGPKGVADLMNSEVGKSARKPAPSTDQDSSQLGKLFSRGLNMVSNLVQGRAREDCPNVCQR